jgi:hypothetical protein
LVFKKYGLDAVIEDDQHIKAYVSSAPGCGGFVTLLISERDENQITRAIGMSLTPGQADELAQVLKHYAKEARDAQTKK